jgi:transposase-like protein
MPTPITMSDQVEQARELYMTQGKTQKEIAAIIGVTERTLYNWIKQHGWDRLRQAAFQAPAIIAENCCSQVVELQNAIAAREPGNRFPTAEEATILSKLIASVDRLKKFPSLPQNMQMMQTFASYIRPKNLPLARRMYSYANEFFEEEAKKGFKPYQLEYGADNISPFLPFGQETGEDPEPDIDASFSGYAEKPESEIDRSFSSGSVENTGFEHRSMPFPVPEIQGSYPLENAGDLPGMPPSRIPFSTGAQSRNAPCACGSGRKFKHCHGKTP